MEFKFKFSTKRILVWLLVLMLFLPFLFSLLDPTGILPKIGLSQAIADIKDSKVQSMEIRGDEVMLKYSETDLKVTRKEEGSSWVETLQREGVDAGKVKIEVASQETGKLIGSILVNVLPILGFGVILYMMTRQARGTQDSVFGFGKSKAKLFAKGKQNVKFGDVAGVDEAKKELEEVVDFLKHPKKFRILGARTPKGVLLVGPSGVGKTLLARAVAGEANVPFFSMAGSEFMEMFVGVGASRVRDLFLTAKKSAPAIVFIDELDAIGRMRGGGNSMGGHDEREQTLNQILVEMDGFTMNDNVIVLAATNRPDVLDPALVRPGRFDRRVSLDLPDIEGRQEILKIHAKNKPFEKNVDWRKIAKRTVGFSGADLENMLNEAAIYAARTDRKAIDMNSLEEAATRVKLGPQKKRLQSDEERRMTAYHEAGHAVAAHFLPGTDPIHRVSIVSRGMALGTTEATPSRDKYQQTKSELLDQMAMMLGGRTAEKIVFNELTAGAASDIERATRVARRMVIDFGMSELGPVAMGPMWEVADWGKAMMEPENISEATKAKIDDEVRRLLEDASKVAMVLLKKHRKDMDRLVEVLLEQETVEGDEFEKLMGEKKSGNHNGDLS
ncbi:cell division protein FtsH [Candidatus Collierbacteria bacterium RIFOXYB1_FULL_49_13]|uniref:ATP-dependent zinc metalloprotease FtsH n=1 Tax=Candidatus Collierbacteria bacterium RIFOXYB1_FULL_49_13 TaxID=1817728 RepID=A0A1F5FKK4_9BACT|nr:MAG: cell division protein FtsH [Candidatus Collierbacteria bacterium RIFOXYB1_FULL_49_13]